VSVTYKLQCTTFNFYKKSLHCLKLLDVMRESCLAFWLSDAIIHYLHIQRDVEERSRNVAEHRPRSPQQLLNRRYNHVTHKVSHWVQQMMDSSTLITIVRQSQSNCLRKVICWSFSNV